MNDYEKSEVTDLAKILFVGQSNSDPSLVLSLGDGVEKKDYEENWANTAKECFERARIFYREMRNK